MVVHDWYHNQQTIREPLCSVDEYIVIMEEKTPIRAEMFHCRIKFINQNNFALIVDDFSL